jgi:DNA-directed RNA polymerase subunit beta
MPATFEEDLYESFANLILGEKLPLDIVNAQTGLVMIPANKKITRTLIRMMVNDYLHLEIDPSPVNNRLMKIIYDMEKKWNK